VNEKHLAALFYHFKTMEALGEPVEPVKGILFMNFNKFSVIIEIS
jgi:hypothetical protein